MPEATFACPKCKTPVAVPDGVGQLSAECPGCSSALEAYFFPALFRPRETGAVPAGLVDHTEASCYYHPQKQAVQICDGCGRLLCALCSIDLADEHICPNCLSSGKRKGKITTLENSRTCYDRIALSLAIIGIVASPVAIILGPVALYFALRHWKSPGSLLGVSRTRFVIAIVLAALEVVIWLLVFGAIIFSHSGTLVHHR